MRKHAKEWAKTGSGAQNVEWLSAETKPHEWEAHWKTQGCQKRHEMQLRPQGAPGTGPATIGREGDQLDLDTAFFKADPHQ